MNTAQRTQARRHQKTAIFSMTTNGFRFSPPARATLGSRDVHVEQCVWKSNGEANDPRTKGTDLTEIGVKQGDAAQPRTMAPRTRSSVTAANRRRRRRDKRAEKAPEPATEVWHPPQPRRGRNGMEVHGVFWKIGESRMTKSPWVERAHVDRRWQDSAARSTHAPCTQYRRNGQTC